MDIPGRVAEQQPSGVLQKVCLIHEHLYGWERDNNTRAVPSRTRMLFLQPQLLKPRMIEIIAIKTKSGVSKGKNKGLKKVSRTEESVAEFL